jgi:hypothetical protein
MHTLCSLEHICQSTTALAAKPLKTSCAGGRMHLICLVRPRVDTQFTAYPIRSIAQIAVAAVGPAAHRSSHGKGQEDPQVRGGQAHAKPQGRQVRGVDRGPLCRPPQCRRRRRRRRLPPPQPQPQPPPGTGQPACSSLPSRQPCLPPAAQGAQGQAAAQAAGEESAACVSCARLARRHWPPPNRRTCGLGRAPPPRAVAGDRLCSAADPAAETPDTEACYGARPASSSHLPHHPRPPQRRRPGCAP